MFLGIGLPIGGSLGMADLPPLWGNGEQGFLIDPSAAASLFQDDAGTAPVTAAGQSVGLIRDGSGRGNHAKQATASKRPTFSFDEAGRPHIFSDGIDDALQTAAFPWASGEVTVVAAVRRYSATGIQQIAGLGDAAADAGSWALMAQGGAASVVPYGARRRLAAGTAHFYSKNKWPAPETAVISMLQRQGAPVIELRRNGIGDGLETEQNFVRYPDDVSLPPWQNQGGLLTITEDAAAAPDGTNSAAVLVSNSGTGLHRVHQPTALALGSAARFSVFLKGAGTRFVYVNCSALLSGLLTIDLNTGAWVSNGTAAVSVEAQPGGWFKVQLSGTVQSTVAGPFLQANTSLVASDQSFAGDGVSAFQVWGARLEVSEVGQFGTRPLWIGGPASFFSGRIYGLLAVNRVLTDLELQQAERWAGRRCGVNI